MSSPHLIPDAVRDAVWRDSRFLVLPRDGRLTHRCVRCGQPATSTIRRREVWHPAAYYWLLMVSPLIYVVVAWFVRRKARFELGLCARHRAGRRRDRVISVSLLLAGVAALVGCFPLDSPALLCTGLGLLLVGMLSWLGTRTPVVRRIDETHVWLDRVSEQVLNDLPYRPVVPARGLAPAGLPRAYVANPR